MSRFFCLYREMNYLHSQPNASVNIIASSYSSFVSNSSSQTFKLVTSFPDASVRVTSFGQSAHSTYFFEQPTATKLKKSA